MPRYLVERRLGAIGDDQLERGRGRLAARTRAGLAGLRLGRPLLDDAAAAGLPADRVAEINADLSQD